MAQYIEDAPLIGTFIRQYGLKTKQPVDFSQASSVALPAGVTAGAQTITSSSANALSVGRQGTTSPALNIDASAVNSATGINIAAAASGSGVAITVLGGTNESLTIDAKGTGNTTIGGSGSATQTGLTVGSAVNAASTVLNVISTSASALTVGRQGATNPVLKVDASVASTVTGIAIQGQSATFAPTITPISSVDTNLGITVNAKGTGVVTIGSGTNSVTIGGSAGTTVFNTNASSFSVGQNGATNPALNVDTSTASSVTGLNIKSAATGNGITVSVISSSSNESIIFQGLGSGNFQINAATLFVLPVGGAWSGGVTAKIQYGDANHYFQAVQGGSTTWNTIDNLVIQTTGGGGSQSITLTPGSGGIIITDAKNIVLGSTTGTQIGTATTQKMSFYGSTPVIQQTSAANLTNNVTAGGSNDIIANYTDLTVYANDSAAIRNDLYQLARKVKQVNDALRVYGLLS